jgi:hypothetical protein
VGLGISCSVGVFNRWLVVYRGLHPSKEAVVGALTIYCAFIPSDECILWFEVAWFRLENESRYQHLRAEPRRGLHVGPGTRKGWER